MPTKTIEAPETYRYYEDKLDEDNHLFQCGGCGHYAGDPRSGNFLARCAGCKRINRHFRIIE